MTVATDLVDPLTLPISWKDIGGLREVIDEIKVRINSIVLITIKVVSYLLNGLHHSVLDLRFPVLV